MLQISHWYISATLLSQEVKNKEAEKILGELIVLEDEREVTQTNHDEPNNNFQNRNQHVEGERKQEDALRRVGGGVFGLAALG